MTALTLLNKHLNRNLVGDFDRYFGQVDTDFNRSFLRPTWFRGFDDAETVYETASEMKFDQETSTWHFTVEVAGVAKNNLKLDAKEGLLTLSGEKTRGLSKGKFERAYRLPEGIDVDHIEAEFEDGVLMMKLPLEKNKQAKAIAIK